MWQALEHAHCPSGRTEHCSLRSILTPGASRHAGNGSSVRYNRLPRPLRVPFTLAVIAPAELKAAGRALLTLHPQDYVRSWMRYGTQARGMHRWRDIVDWVGGYPYEVATPDQVFEFFKARGLSLTRLKCGGVGLGCNEFVFVRNDRPGETRHDRR